MGRQLLGEHVGDVVVRPHVRHDKLHGLDHVPYVKVTALDMLAAPVVLGVIGEVASALVVSSAARGPRRRLPEACEEFAEVNEILSPLGEGIDLGLTRGEGSGGLLSGGPRNSSPLPLDVIPRRGATGLERGIVKPHGLTWLGVIPKAHGGVTRRRYTNTQSSSAIRAGVGLDMLRQCMLIA